ncbi:zinc finger, CCHC-type containing protein [Tanacetum coccineum]
MTDSRPVLEQYNELLGILGRFTQHNMNLDESIKVSYIIDKLPPSWKDFKHTLKHLKEELTLIELGSHLRIEESIRAQDNNKPKGNNVAGHSVCAICGGHTTPPVQSTRCAKDRAVQDDEYRMMRSILHMGNESTAFVHRRGCVDLRLNIVSDNIGSAFMSTSKLNDSILWHARLCHVHFKRLQDMSKDGLIPAFDMDTKKCQTCMLNKITKKPFQNVKCKTKVLELIHSNLYDLHATSSLGNKKYAEHSKAFRFYVIEPNDSVAINSIIESRDAIFDEHMFSFVPRLSQRSLVKGTIDSGGSVVSERVTNEIVQQFEPRKSKRHRNPKDFGPEFQLYLVEGTRDKVSDQNSYCFNVEDDPKTFNEAMKSQDVAFWKEAIADEMDSIMGNNTWVLTDLPPGCRPLGCKWIFKRKLKVDGTVEKFKASLIIHKIDVKIAFLNGELEEEVYMNQPLGFILPDNENKVCKLIKSLYGIKHAPKQWYQKFNEVVLSNGYILNQADKCVYSKFDASGKGVIICLYVNDMLIFGTDQVYVDLTKEFLSPSFYIKDMGEADVILGIRIKHESNGIAISQYHCIEKVLKKFNYSDCTPVSTPMDTCEKLMPNRGLAVSQLEEGLTSNPCTQHWQEIQRQTCITGSTMESEFVALAAAGKEAEWLKNLLLKIPLWVKPMTPISILCDSTATLAKAYSQMYNGKSRHLGVRHSMIRELITNGVISIEFVRSQQNLADHLTKGLARDLVLKSEKRMGLKSNEVVEC